MKLNINLISHPLIQHLSNTANNSIMIKNQNNQSAKYLGLLIIYETIRKWMRNYELNIKLVKSLKTVSIIDPKESYTVIFNDLGHLSMCQEIQIVIPNTNLNLIHNHDIKILKSNHQTDHSTSNKFNNKIIIINDKLNIDYIQNLISVLIEQNNFQLNQIRVICISCETDKLIRISENKLYKNLEIYTTKIINN